MTVVTNPARTSSDEGLNPGPEIDNPEQAPEYTATNFGVIEHADVLESSSDNSNGHRDESRCDVVFVAGVNGDTYQFPGHRRVLAAVSPVFGALLNNTKADVIVVDYVDRRGFEQLLRYHYCETVQLHSVATTRVTLDTAFKFLCPPLTERCAKRLDEMLDAQVALEVMRDLRYLCAQLPGAASAPPLAAFGNNIASRYLGLCSSWCDSLAHNALLVIDEFADEVLQNENLEDLTYEDLSLIVKRDTLRVSNELLLVEALSRWSTAACKRTLKEVTSANKRAVLGELSYCPRYLLLEREDLDHALEMELLEPIERALVIGRARKLASPVPVGADQENLLRRWARPRPSSPAALPVHLSARSEPTIEEPRASGLFARKPKKLKPPSFEPKEEEPEKQGCWAAIGDCLLRAFICLFD